nr:hypothetical protein [Pseudomonas sp. FW300-N1A1]
MQRPLGSCLDPRFEVEGVNREAYMLAEGFAYRVAVPASVDLVSCRQAAERVARQAGLGSWWQSPVLKAEQITACGFAVTGGRVSRGQCNRGGVWIELQGLVVLRVAPNQFNPFELPPLERRKGKRIEARGWVPDRSRQGRLQFAQACGLRPLTHPTMLQVST